MDALYATIIEVFGFPTVGEEFPMWADAITTQKDFT